MDSESTHSINGDDQIKSKCEEMSTFNLSEKIYLYFNEQEKDEERHRHELTDDNISILSHNRYYSSHSLRIMSPTRPRPEQDSGYYEKERGKEGREIVEKLSSCSFLYLT